LDRAIAEAAVKPPMTLPPIDTLGVQITAPLHKFAAGQEAGKEAAYVKRMHKEFKKTGKVSKTLPSDDKEVRALYAAEVLNVPVSKLDAEMPRALGTAHGKALASAPKAAAPRAEVKAASAPQAEIAAPAEPKPKKEPKPKAEKAAAPAKEKPAAAPKAAKPPSERKKKKEAETVYDPDSPFAVLRQNNTTAAPVAEDAALDAPAPIPAPPPGVRLHLEDHIVDAPAIGPKAAARFEAIGFKTVADLLEASPEDIAKSLRASHMTPPIIRDWQAQALLACTLPNVRSIDAQALVANNVRDADALVKQDAKKLLQQIEAFFNTPNGKQLARGGKPPTLDVVKSWIEAAKKTPKQAIRAA
jgi:predicted flap endonuclease-1-like 5' DNA nuclease